MKAHPQPLDFSQVEHPIETARGLPPRVYTDPAWLEKENLSLFSANWIAVAIDSDIPEAGDALPVNAAGQALIIVRGVDQKIRVFYNVCRHRGTQLLDSPCKGRQLLVCPYHAWSYDLTGKLMATPHFSGIDNHDHSLFVDGSQNLREVRSGVWNHIIFVNIDGNAESLAQATRRIDERWADYDLQNVYPGGTDTFEMKANWKLVLENFVESYHLPMVHRGLTDYSPLSDHELVVDDTIMGQISLNYQPEDEGAILPRFSDLPEFRLTRGEYLLLFPNLMLSVTPDHFRVTLITPVNSALTRQRWIYFFVGEQSIDERFNRARDAVVGRIGSVTAEDVAILEKMQAGRYSNGFDGGRFSAFHEKTTYRFHQLVAQHLAPDINL